MNTIQRIAKNIGSFYMAQAISCILNFFFIMYTARYLGVEGFGVLSFALAFTGIFGVLTDLGLRQLTTREVAKDKSLTGKYLGNIVLIKIILVTITFALIILFINLLGYPEKTIKIVYLVALAVFFGAFSQMFYSVFQAFERIEYQSLGYILNSALLLAGALFAISRGLSIFAFAFLYFFASAFTFLYNFIVSQWKFPKPRIEVDWSFWKLTIKQALPFGLIGVFGVIYHWIDTVMLSLMKGDTVVGWYNAAYRLFMIFLIIPSTFDLAIFPVMSRFYISSADSLKFTYERTFKYLTIIGIFIAICITLLAHKIILLIFGNEYAPSIVALQILIWASLFIFMGTPFSSLLNSANRQSTLAKIVGSSAVLNILLNLLLIPRYSYIAASITTVISTFLILLCVIVVTSRMQYKIQTSLTIKLLLRLFISGLMMGIFIVYFKNINLLLLITFSLLIYLGIFYIIKGFDKEDVLLLQSIIRRK